MTVGPVAAVDRLAGEISSGSLIRLTVAATPEDRAAAFRLRCAAVLAQGWLAADAFPDGMECDDDDAAAVHVVGWDGETAVCTARLVLPSDAPLPTERACGLVVQPRGRVVDVGRIVVAPPWRDRRHGVLVPLLCFTYLQLRERDFTIACGMMTAPLRTMARMLGVRLDVLGGDRTYWHQPRAPIRFDTAANAPTLLERWADDGRVVAATDRP